MTVHSLIETLGTHRVLICAGTGGVGKTTISASLGVMAAREGLRTLVLTIDPAHRLAQALNLDSKAGQIVEVPGVPNLRAAMIDPRREFDEFVLGSVDNTIAKGLFSNRLYQQLVSNLQGSQEFTSLVRLLKASRDSDCDLVILDTPPTQNAVDFLRAPERLYALFEDSVISWFSDAESDENWLKKTLYRGTRLVTTALEAVTGSTFIKELKDFFRHLSHLQKQVAQVSDDVNKLLHASSTGFFLVTGFDETKLREALEFQQDLQGAGLGLKGVIVNRWFAQWMEGHSRWPKEWEQDSNFRKLEEFHVQFSEFFKNRQDSFDRFVAQVEDTIPVVKLPDFDQAVQGIEDLQKMADTLKERWK